VVGEYGAEIEGILFRCQELDQLQAGGRIVQGTGCAWHAIVVRRRYLDAVPWIPDRMPRPCHDESPAGQVKHLRIHVLVAQNPYYKRAAIRSRIQEFV